jgi:hypothetical protein
MGRTRNVCRIFEAKPLESRYLEDQESDRKIT